jgi:membrane-associated phospholipid phosphatase
MDYDVVHALNVFIREHALLVPAAQAVATWIVPAVVAATVLPWLVSGRGVDARKRASAGALAAAAVALAANQVVIQLWQRPRPYAGHAGIVPLAGRSGDPSFPSDHAAAAFAIAVAAFLAYRRAGRVLLVLAVATAASRLLVAAHYPSDVLGGAAIGVASGVLVMRLERVWASLVRLVATVTDGARLWLLERPGLRGVVQDRRVRMRVVVLAGLAVGVRIALGLRANLVDELPLALLAGWALCVVGALAATRSLPPPARERH